MYIFEDTIVDGIAVEMIYVFLNVLIVNNVKESGHRRKER
jgi:hypothetical protein